MLKKLFCKLSNQKKIPQNVFSTSDVHSLTECLVLSGQPVFERSAVDKKNGDTASYSIKNKIDKKTFELEVNIHKAGTAYKTHLVAVLHGTSSYEIKSLMIDNHQEKLLSRKEIKDALEHIGKHKIRIIDCERVPKPQKPYSGEFKKTSRGWNRFIS